MVDKIALLHMSEADLRELIPLFGPRKKFQVKLEEYKRTQVS